MSYLLNAAIKGIIEGFTEFLPISSTGHLILVEKLFPLSADTGVQAEKLDALFDLVIQFPAILAIVVLFRRRLWTAALAAREDAARRRFWISLAVAFVPIGIAGLLLHRQAESLRIPAVVAVALIVGGVVLVILERLAMRPSITKGEDVPVATGLSIGVCQCLALIPGTSRSGSAIVAGRLMGLSRTAAAEFSFFLALPTMGAACAYKLLQDYKDLDWHTHGPLLLVGCVTSFFSAWAVVAVFLKLLDKPYGLTMWGWYRIVLGALVLALVR